MVQDSDRLEEILNEIITDRRYIIATDSAGDERVLAIRTPLPAEKHYARHTYRQELKRAKLAGLPSEHEMLESALLRGEWSKDNERLIKLYTTKIKQLGELVDPRNGLFRHNKGKAHKIRLDIIKTRKELEKLQIARDSFLVFTAEYHARNQEFIYVFSRLIMDEYDKQLWTTWKEYQNERDDKLIASVLFKYKLFKSPTESDLRAVARSSGWSVIWNSAKKTASNVFGRPPSDYTGLQLGLLFWSMMYDSVYESMERPSDEIIEDDVKLDKWFEEQREERKKNDKRKRHDRSSTSRHPEQYVMVDNEAEADEVYSMNDKMSLAKITNEIKRISAAAKTKEYVGVVEIKQGEIKRQLLTDKSAVEARRTAGVKAKQNRFIG